VAAVAFGLGWLMRSSDRSWGKVAPGSGPVPPPRSH